MTEDIQAVRLLSNELFRAVTGSRSDVAVMALLDAAIRVVVESGQSNAEAAKTLMEVLRSVRATELMGTS